MAVLFSSAFSYRALIEGQAEEKSTGENPPAKSKIHPCACAGQKNPYKSKIHHPKSTPVPARAKKIHTEIHTVDFGFVWILENPPLCLRGPKKSTPKSIWSKSTVWVLVWIFLARAGTGVDFGFAWRICFARVGRRVSVVSDHIELRSLKQYRVQIRTMNKTTQIRSADTNNE